MSENNPGQEEIGLNLANFLDNKTKLFPLTYYYLTQQKIVCYIYVLAIGRLKKATYLQVINIFYIVYISLKSY